MTRRLAILAVAILAAMRADELLDAGDMDGRAVWLRIVRVVKELLAKQRPADTTGFRVMMAAGHRWGRGSLGEAATLCHRARILMLTRANRVTSLPLSGKSRLISAIVMKNRLLRQLLDRF